MSPDQINNFLSEWFDRASRAEAAHYESASFFGQLHYTVGLPAMALSTVVGSSVLADVSGTWAIVVGVMSIIAAVLSGVQTFLKLGDRAEAHRSAGSRFSALKREIEQKLLFQETINEEYLSDLRMRWDVLTDEAPTIPEKIWFKKNI